LNRFIWTCAAIVAVALVPSLSLARDFGVSYPTIQKGKFSSSLLYSYIKVEDDFDARGRADFKSHVVGSQFAYGITDTMGVSVKGGALVDPEEEAQGATWKGSAGYLYGFDLYNEVFPATGVWPGVMVSAGMTGFMAPFSSVVGSSTPINQRISGIEYHGSVVLGMKWGRFSPYGGVKIFERSLTWRDNQPLAGQTASIDGDSHGNAALILGLPIRITEAIQFNVEAVLVTQTAITAGITIGL
jgi:hypothetical protein